MKRLILIRHGDAPNTTNSDIERTLSMRGEKQALLSAEYLKSYKIDNILCSPTIRTKQTLKILADNLNLQENRIEYCHQILVNSLESLLSLLNTVTYENETILIVGHNPSLLELALHFDFDADDKWHDMIMLGLKPAEVIVLEFADASSWNDLNQGKIKDIFIPG